MLNKVESAKEAVLRVGLARYPGEVEGTACEKRSSQTREELEHLFSVIETARELIEQLAIRLQDVTRPECAKENSKNPPDVALVPLAEEVKTSRKRIQTINENIVGLLQSIEL